MQSIPSYYVANGLKLQVILLRVMNLVTSPRLCQEKSSLKSTFGQLYPFPSTPAHDKTDLNTLATSE